MNSSDAVDAAPALHPGRQREHDAELGDDEPPEQQPVGRDRSGQLR